jgi:uncharacterized protein (DUF2141 family)
MRSAEIWGARWVLAGMIAGAGYGLVTEASAAPENVVRFRVTELRDDRGHVLCGLYKDRENWLGERPAFGARARVHDGHAVCVFRDVPPGEYAISALHDADDDESMDKNALGLPTEGYCASHDAQADGVGAPDWNDAVFTFKGGRMTLEAHMHY